MKPIQFETILSGEAKERSLTVEMTRGKLWVKDFDHPKVVFFSHLVEILLDDVLVDS